MEDQISKRYLLAEHIFGLLSENEEEGIRLWNERKQELRYESEKELPTVDVLACVYNAAGFVSNSIESVCLQSYPNLRLIIVNDGSTDGSSDLLKHYAEKYPNILLIENPLNKGIVYSANKGLTYCTGTYVARMDLDDLIHPLRIEKQVAFLLGHPEISAVSSWVRTFGDGSETRDITYREDFDEQKITQLFYSPLAHAACTFKSEVIKELAYSDNFNDRGEDYHMFFRLMQTHKTAVLQECLYLYRTHSLQVTNKKHSGIISDSTFKILHLIFDAMSLKHTDEDIRFHMDYLVYARELPDKESWMQFDQWLNRIVRANARSAYFNQDKLIHFIQFNYWQTAFDKFSSNKISLNYLIKILFSPIHIANKKLILKLILKRLFI